VEILRSFVQTYSSVTFEAPDGIELRLYGLGKYLKVSQEDPTQLATLGAELPAAIWKEQIHRALSIFGHQHTIHNTEEKKKLL
jgi:hypothetical protein